MEIIKLKGTGDGVKIYLDETADFSEIIIMLKNKLEEFRRFFGNGHCNIYFFPLITKYKQKNNDSKISELLYKVNGVESVNTVCQNDEINR